MPERGWETVTVPGAVSGWRALSQRFGELPFADLFEPAIRYARDGFAVSPSSRKNGRWRCRTCRSDLGWFEHFMPRGRPPAPGERLVERRAGRHARRRSRDTDGEAFYRGELAEAMVRHSQSANGAHALADFAEHTCRLGDAARASTIAA